MRPTSVVMLTLGLAAGLAGGRARAQPLTREDLTQALAARDRTIAELQQRIDALEKARAAPAATTAPPILTVPGTPSGSTATQKTTPATESQDEVALEALSRTLVQRGGLLLPAWRAEFIPSLAYSNREVQGLALVPTPEGIPTVADQRLRNDEVRASAALRLGLPGANQFELRVPYGWLRQSRAVGNGVQAVNEDSGLGDVEVAFSHQFFREHGWRPDLVGALSWRFDTGADPFIARVAAVSPGTGVRMFGARLTAVKSTDPMVFFSTLSFGHPLIAREPFGEIQQGEVVGLDLGAILSVSPQTSLTFGLSQQFQGRTRVDGVGVPGTDSTVAQLQLGVDRVLTQRLLLDVSLGVGLTRDAPDYTFQVSLPFRFH